MAINFVQNEESVIELKVKLAVIVRVTVISIVGQPQHIYPYILFVASFNGSFILLFQFLTCGDED